jgi:hypothetical protein
MVMPLGIKHYQARVLPSEVGKDEREQGILHTLDSLLHSAETDCTVDLGRLEEVGQKVTRHYQDRYGDIVTYLGRYAQQPGN